MLSNTIFPSHKKSDTSSEKFIKTSGDFYDNKHALVTTTDTVVKEGNNEMFDKGMFFLMWRNPSLLLFQGEKKLDTGNKTEKSKASNKTVDTPKKNKTDTVRSLDTSRPTQRNDTENTVDK